MTGWPQAYSRSKQNSDAAGMMYQWGCKDPFTFATSSLNNGSGTYAYGKYPVKIYNVKRELIYQKDDGRSNLGMTPTGGIIISSTAKSMMETIKKPNIYYWSNNAVVSQVGHSKELWNYYWTSYSRGADGKGSWNTPIQFWHNTYLDGYIVLRSKSIYDPCPYGYRTPTNGTYNDITINPGWRSMDYAGGINWNTSWLNITPLKYEYFYDTGYYIEKTGSTIFSFKSNYLLSLSRERTISRNVSERAHFNATSVRCIEEAMQNSLQVTP